MRVNRSRVYVRRILSLTVAALAGLAAAGVASAPAHADGPPPPPPLTITEDRSCDPATGSWTVAWKLINGVNSVATITAITPDPGASGAIFNQAITVGSTIPASGTLIGHLVFPNTATTA